MPPTTLKTWFRGFPMPPTTDYTIIVRYLFPMEKNFVSWGAIGIGEDKYFLDNMFFGCDIGMGFDSSHTVLVMGLNIGEVHDFGNRLQLVYGGSVGGYAATVKQGHFLADYWIAPLVKLRWYHVEIAYKWHLGYGNFRYYLQDDEKVGFNWKHHEITIGVYYDLYKSIHPRP